MNPPQPSSAKHSTHPLLAGDVAPDAAGLEPALDPLPELARHRPADSTGRHSRADLPVTVASIMALALPTIIDQLFSAGVGLTDTIVAGHTGPNDNAHAAASAAIGTVTYLQWFAGLMTSALGVGATAIVARAIGAKRPRLATRVAGSVCSAALLVGLAVALAFFLFPMAFSHLFGLRGLAADYGAQYLRIMSLTVCLQCAGQIGMACLRGSGDTFRPMVVTVAIFFINAIASPALTFGWFGLPALGIRGNAIGTLLSFFAAGIVTFYFLVSPGAGLHLQRRHFRIMPHLVMRVLRIGMPSWLENIFLWSGQVFIVIFVISPTDLAIGVDGATMGAHNATLRIESLAFLPGFGFGIACSALVGQYLGAKKLTEARHAANLCNRLALLTMSVVAIPMILFPRLLLGLMVESDAVVRTGTIPLILAGLAQPGFAIAIARSGALKGAGDTVSSMIATISGMGLRLLLLLIVILLFHAQGHAAWGLIAVWIAIFLDLNYRAFYTTLAFRAGRWQFKKV